MGEEKDIENVKNVMKLEAIFVLMKINNYVI